MSHVGHHSVVVIGPGSAEIPALLRPITHSYGPNQECLQTRTGGHSQRESIGSPKAAYFINSYRTFLAIMIMVTVDHTAELLLSELVLEAKLINSADQN